MRKGLYYMNNSGSRWVVFDNDGKHEEFTFQTKSGNKITRRVQYYESFGNFAVACISYKGKKITVFPDSLLDD